uniref:Uncharacterized protein n=1 Tax=Equus asinus asinus TaxID=83772 RepID=A0A8C4LVE5_EQUAS
MARNFLNLVKDINLQIQEEYIMSHSGLNLAQLDEAQSGRERQRQDSKFTNQSPYHSHCSISGLWDHFKWPNICILGVFRDKIFEE